MYYFIVNPSSRSGQGRRVWQQVEAELERLSMEYRVFFTSGQFHATNLSREITHMPGRHTLVAVGGDGTINEVINGIQDFDRITFAYIPTGSSNDFARSLGLPSDPMQALHNILHPTYYTRIDLGQMEYGNHTRLFAVSCGMGFDAAVCEEAFRSRIKHLLNRLGLGKLTYVGIALHQMILLRAHPIYMTVDSSLKKAFPRTFFISVLNCPYEGGGLKLCPKASPSDRQLDYCVVERMSKLFLSLMLPTAYFGKHTRFRGIHIDRGTVIHLKSPIPLPVHADGEVCQCQTSLSIRCIPEKLKIISGR
ncbi:MAG: diacylglycerol kinase family lipid kinase [Lachnospiraceae bacterium]|nr:diacylglycerol kinase family lipid kinase [Lachnospiraceae bacterium]